jgi:hypothetical protein
MRRGDVLHGRLALRRLRKKGHQLIKLGRQVVAGRQAQLLFDMSANDGHLSIAKNPKVQAGIVAQITDGHTGVHR